MQQAFAVLLDHAVTGIFAAAIDSQDAHCRECSRRGSLAANRFSSLFAFRSSLGHLDRGLQSFRYCHPERGAKRGVEGPAFLKIQATIRPRISQITADFRTVMLPSRRST